MQFVYQYTKLYDSMRYSETALSPMFVDGIILNQMDKRVSLNEALDAEKAASQSVKKIRDGILEETFKPQDRLIEQDLAERFNVSRSPVREALLALEKEGTVIISPYKGAIVKPLSKQEAIDIAELRLALISLARPVEYAEAADQS